MPQTYRVTLSDGRSFDVTTEGGPPSEESIMANLSQVPEMPEPPKGSALERFGGAVADSFKGAATVTGVPGFLREGPIGAVKDQLGVVRGLLGAQFDEFRKAGAAFKEGRTSEMVGHLGAGVLPIVGPMASRMGEQIASGDLPELAGEAVANVALGPLALRAAGAAGSGVRGQFRAATAKRAARSGAAMEGDLMMAVPPSKSAPYTSGDYRAARPYLNAQHESRPIRSVVEFEDAANGAIGEIESRIASINEAFPEARLNPGEAVARKVAEAFKENPRGGALEAGLKELDDLGLNRDLTLPELDAIRSQLNAENRGIQKKNNYDKATARKVDPGFAAREAAAEAIRDVQYGYLEQRGVEGVRQLRRDEGSLIRVRDAVARQRYAGERGVAGTEGGPVRQALATLVDQVVPAPGVVTQPIAKVIRGGRKTKDDLIARVFAGPDTRRPVYPAVPARRPVAGALPPSSVPPQRPSTGPIVGPSGEPVTTPITPRTALPAGRPPVVTEPPADTSGRIPATLPEHYVREQAALGDLADEMGMRRTAADVVPEERSFILRWLADDLREVRHQGQSRMRGVHAIDEATDRRAGERATNWVPPAAGTPTQEMFHALGITGTRSEIATKIDNYLRGSGRKGDKLEALGDALREAWDGKAFDFDLISDETMRRLGIRRKDLKSPVSTPNPDDAPSVYERFFKPEEEAPGVTAAGKRDIFTEAATKVRARKSKAIELASSGEAVPMVHPSGRHGLIGPDMSKPGRFRMTRFDEKGDPVGHLEFKSLEEAIESALSDGFNVMGAE